jgi:hypothetical protein
MFRGPSSVTIWRAAVCNTEPTLPPAPDGMNELQYGNLLYCEHCHVRCLFVGQRDFV